MANNCTNQSAFIENGDLLEDETHSFVVTILLEETPEESEQAKWRGHITHVLSGDQRYFDDLSKMIDFIIPYMEKMGIKLPGPNNEMVEQNIGKQEQ